MANYKNRLSIVLVDAWFHVATKTVEIIQLVENTPPLHSFGRRILSDCLLTPPNTAPCTISSTLTMEDLTGAEEAFKTVHNLSTINQLVTVDFKGNTYVFLGDQEVPTSLDFMASTSAISTQCIPISTACDLHPANEEDSLLYGIDSVPYNCSPQFAGDASWQAGIYSVGYNFWNQQFFNDSELNEWLPPTVLCNAKSSICCHGR